MAGVPPDHKRHIERGDYNPTIKLCTAICRALNKTLDGLFWEEQQ